MTTFAWPDPRRARHALKEAVHRIGAARRNAATVPAQAEAASPTAIRTTQLFVWAKRGRANVAVVGQLDRHTAPELVDCVERLVDGGARSVVVELGGCEVADSAGLDALVTTAARVRRRRGELVLKSPRSQTVRLPSP